MGLWGRWYSDIPGAHHVEPQTRSLATTLGLIGAAWLAADAGYYFALPLLTEPLSYNAAPTVIGLYYAAWIAIAVTAFRSLYRGWIPHENSIPAHGFIWTGIGALALFAVYAVPALPKIVWTETWSPPELMRVTPWYFLPKSIEILFQQLLIAATVFALSAHRVSIRTMSIGCALLFGASHLLLAFGGVPFGYVLRFVAAATAFGLLFPYLILRVRNGFLYSYGVHWLYYVVTIVMAHTFSPYVVR